MELYSESYAILKLVDLSSQLSAVPEKTDWPSDSDST
jgi:hypothetical protein